MSSSVINMFVLASSSCIGGRYFRNWLFLPFGDGRMNISLWAQEYLYYLSHMYCFCIKDTSFISGGREVIWHICIYISMRRSATTELVLGSDSINSFLQTNHKRSFRDMNPCHFPLIWAWHNKTWYFCLILQIFEEIIKLETLRVT